MVLSFKITMIPSKKTSKCKWPISYGLLITLPSFDWDTSTETCSVVTRVVIIQRYGEIWKFEGTIIPTHYAMNASHFWQKLATFICVYIISCPITGTFWHLPFWILTNEWYDVRAQSHYSIKWTPCYVGRGVANGFTRKIRWKQD